MKMPKWKLQSLSVYKEQTLFTEIEEQDSLYLSEILLYAPEIAVQTEIDQTGYRLITNCENFLTLPKESKKKY